MFGRPVSCLLVLVLLAAACASDAATDATSTVAAPEVATAAPEPTSPTAVPTAEPEPTAEPVPTAVPTAEPEPTAEPTAVPTQTYDAPGALELSLPLPTGEPGELIDVEELVLSYGIGHRLLYHSTATDGDAVAVSGFVAFPDGDVPEGGWPLVAWAHGTTGLGDSCAPSHAAETDQLAMALVAFGYAVVATDYEGLGTPGTHPYVVGPSEAYGVLDSVRAVQHLGAPVAEEFVVFGHSQGGHAAMFAGQLHPSYAPELNMIGVVAGAPPSQMSDLGDSLVGGNFQGYLIMTAAGLVAAYDDLDLTDVLSDDAISLIDVIEDGCTSEIFEIYNPLDYDEVAVVDDPFSLPGWGDALRANDTNQLPVVAPLLIIHGGEDEQIPVDTSAALFDQLCAFPDQGPTVRNVYAGQSHAGVLSNSATVFDLLNWVQGRFAGDPAPNDCES